MKAAKKAANMKAVHMATEGLARAAFAWSLTKWNLDRKHIPKRPKWDPRKMALVAHKKSPSVETYFTFEKRVSLRSGRRTGDEKAALHIATIGRHHDQEDKHRGACHGRPNCCRP
jgi:hypothetical protein